MKTNYLSLILILVLIFGILVVSGCAEESEEPKTEEPEELEEPGCIEDWGCTEWTRCSLEGKQTRVCTDKNDCGTTENKPKESQTCTFEFYKIGEILEINEVGYTVDEAFTLSWIGSEYLYEEPDGIFVILSLTVKNNGKDSIYLTSSDFKLTDSQDRKYTVDTSAGLYLNIMGYESFTFKKLGPGLETTGEIVFDVPGNDEGLILQISGEGLLGMFDYEYVEIGDVSGL